jgi:sulfur carrier protein
MKIQVNNQPVAVEEHATLETVIASLEQVPTGCGGMAVAVNDELVPRAEWAAHTLQEGDRVLVIKAAYGG